MLENLISYVFEPDPDDTSMTLHSREYRHDRRWSGLATLIVDHTSTVPRGHRFTFFSSMRLEPEVKL